MIKNIVAGTTGAYEKELKKHFGAPASRKKNCAIPRAISGSSNARNPATLPLMTITKP